MSIKKSNYDNLEWVDALKARMNPRNYEARFASTPEKDAVEDALQQTVEAVFNVPTGEETSEEAISRTSKDIQAEAMQASHKAMIDEIKAKLGDRDKPIDPVVLGVEVKDFTSEGMKVRPITQDEWDNSTDSRFIEGVAKMAVLAFEKKRSQEWQVRAMETKQTSRSFDPEFSRDGRIMYNPAQGDDSAPRFGRVPANANSIWDPERIQKLSEALLTSHDQNVKSSKEYYKERSEKADLDRVERAKDSSVISQDTGSKIINSGNAESEAFIQRVPKDQLSMLDVKDGDFDGMTPEQKKARLEEIFLKKVPDPKTETKKANEERRQEIQGKKNKDRSWEKLAKPLSTSELQKRLIERWIPEEPKDK